MRVLVIDFVGRVFIASLPAAIWGGNCVWLDCIQTAFRTGDWVGDVGKTPVGVCCRRGFDGGVVSGLFLVFSGRALWRVP